MMKENTLSYTHI